jgi:hypothetical protein
MCVNGMGVLYALRQKDAALVVTETHPKVLYFALTGMKHDWTASRGAMTAWLTEQLGQVPLSVSSEHEFDALASAWACAQGVLGRWTGNLHAPCVGGPLGGTTIRPAGPTSYFWP